MGTHNRVRLKNLVFKGVVGSTDISTRSVQAAYTKIRTRLELVFLSLSIPSGIAAPY